ncbi:MAG: metalloregulator ArsR/SmtB family transcription factor [Acidimicrobiales bacterium]
MEPPSLFDVLSSPIRREILWLTRDREMAAGEIAQQFDRSAATISTHLTVLREAGLLEQRVDGNFRRYRCARPALDAALPLLAADDGRWIAADEIPEAGDARATTGLAVTVAIDVPLLPDTAFAAFVDGDRFADWLGVPVSIRENRFRATMEWGTEVGASTRRSAPVAHRDAVGLRRRRRATAGPRARRLPAHRPDTDGIPGHDAPTRRHPGAGRVPVHRVVAGARPVRVRPRRGHPATPTPDPPQARPPPGVSAPGHPGSATADRAPGGPPDR